MQPEFITGKPLLEAAWAVGIFVVSVVAAWLIVRLTRLFITRLKGKTRGELFWKLLQNVSRPLFFILIIEGLILSLSSVTYLDSWDDSLGKAGIAVVIAGVTYGMSLVGSTLLHWYLRRARVRQTLAQLAQRITLLVILAIGLLVLLDYLGIEISPLIAGLGIGGLAIALALQPTLANFFAGTQIVVDHVVRVGDYVELEGAASVKGYVTDIGWRSTRIRTSFNNMVIVPNSRLADSIITNYYGPTMEMAVMVECGVSYNANLPKVEEISRRVAREVIDELDEAVKTFEPWFAYDEFGDSNINFWIWVQAKDRISTFKLKSEIIKRLKSALDAEGITINYPARLLTFEHPEQKKPPFLEPAADQGEGKG